jgi:GTP pyrophosphokinase
MEPERLIEAKWDSVIDQNFIATLNIDAGDYVGLLADIAAVIANLKVPITSAYSKIGKNKDAMISISVEIKSLEQLDVISKKIRAIKGVIDVHR